MIFNFPPMPSHVKMLNDYQTQKAKSEVPSVARPAPPLPVATHPPEFVILFDGLRVKFLRSKLAIFV